ncbi:CDP-alcohol phosphatidyltransferase family protein [Chitinilyticum litopenaei]|uniref:CDP-alcohol phosphatidyltransferase family protein n=1 Tax=Chitinilyticum litopenaei TaxID=1121276 RepID=UPI00040C287F|nr:CDP-alcohol phosphatidyltransferase family protein [Chitinilyticum litopenaei]
MFDRQLLALARRPLTALAAILQRRGWQADTVSWLGFTAGVLAAGLIALQYTALAVLAIALNRLADGVDGELARRNGPTERGAFLDITLDFLFYALIPLAFALADPAANALAAAVLLFSFVGTGSSFLAFAILAERRGLRSAAYPAKGFYYLGGLTEAGETLLVFVLMCLWPGWFAGLAWGFAALCLLATALRLHAGLRLLAAQPSLPSD